MCEKGSSETSGIAGESDHAKIEFVLIQYLVLRGKAHRRRAIHRKLLKQRQSLLTWPIRKFLIHWEILLVQESWIFLPLPW